jgi:hypothetical protein
LFRPDFDEAEALQSDSRAVRDLVRVIHGLGTDYDDDVE